MKRVAQSLVLAVWMLLSLLTVACGGADREVERVVLVGIDGLDPRVLERLIGEGRLPHLEQFIARGVSGEIATLLPTYSPLLWATVATGTLPARHGIDGFGKRIGSEGRFVPYTSNSRRTKALWNILGERGKRVAVVGWWTTWPAEAVNGVMISDRLLYNRFNLWHGLKHFGAELPAQTHPSELLADLGPAAQIPPGFEQEFFGRFSVDRPPEGLHRDLHDPWYELFLAYARDRTYGAVLDRLLEGERFDFVAHYLNGPDIASHYFWKYLFPEEWPRPIPVEELRRGADVIARYYAYIDESIAPLLAQADERNVVIVVSDHGFVTGERSDSPNISGTHYRAAPPGVLLMAGGGLPAGGTIGPAAIVDMTPTVLHLLGQAVGQDMDGRVLSVVESVVRKRGRDVTFVATYEDGIRSEGGEPLESGQDATIADRLRALGYID